MIITLTVRGGGVVQLVGHGSAPQQVLDLYVLKGAGITGYEHAVNAGGDGRLSVTFRYVTPEPAGEELGRFLSSGRWVRCQSSAH